MADTWTRWAYGNGGWVRFDSADWPGPVYIRFLDQGGRAVASEVYVDTRGARLRSSFLRQLDLSQAEALVMMDSAWQRNAYRLNVPGPDLSRLASHYATNFGAKSDHWVAQSYRSQVAGSGVQKAPMGPEPQTPPVDALPPMVPLDAPTSAGLTDEFLQDVADAYRAAVLRKFRPAPTLAEQAGVSQRTVHGWVFKARKRGFLEAGSQGQVGG